MIDSGGSINNRHGTWISELQLLDTTDQLRFLPNVSHACETLTDISFWKGKKLSFFYKSLRSLERIRFFSVPRSTSFPTE